MVQPSIDSKFSQYGLANSESGFSHLDKQQPVPLIAKKTVLRDLQNENRFSVPKGSSQFNKEGGSVEATKASGIKRPALECLSTHQEQPPVNNAASGPLVYVRRKPEAELGKNSLCDTASYGTNFVQLKEVGDKEEVVQQQLEIKETKISVSGKPSLPPPEKSGKSVVPLSNYLKRISNQHEERYCQLQNALKNMDQSNQVDYVQTVLRSLSSTELSRHAVELERRSIQLSLEEAKEMQRVRVLDVMGKSPKNFRAPSTQEKQPEK